MVTDSLTVNPLAAESATSARTSVGIDKAVARPKKNALHLKMDICL